MSDFDELQIRRIDGGLLLIFRELLKRGRATEVADRLGLSGSAVSHALRRLREVFGDPLFVRRSHGLEPTQRALELGPQVDAVLELLGAVVAHGAPFDAATTRRRFVIACPDAISTLVADRLLESFRTEAPQATFSLRYVILDRALNGVRRGEIDLAIGVFGDIPASLSATTLYRDHYCVLARRGHPEVSGALDRASYRRLGHVFVGTPDTLVDELPIDRATMDATYGGLPTPEQVRTHGYVSQWETAMLLAARSDILVDCPRRLAERFAEPLGLQVLEPPFGRFEMHVQAVRRSTTDPATAWLLEKVAAAAA